MLVHAAEVAQEVGVRVDHDGVGVESALVAIGEDVAADAANKNDQIGVVQALGVRVAAAVAKEAGVGVAAVRDGVVSAEVGHHRDTVTARPSGQLLTGFLGPAFTADDDQRLARRRQLPVQLLQVRGGWLRAGNLAGFHGGVLHDVHQHVFREADHHGAGASAEGGEDGVVHHAGGGSGVVEGHYLLGGTAEPGVDIEFLEGLTARGRPPESGPRKG